MGDGEASAAQWCENDCFQLRLRGGHDAATVKLLGGVGSFGGAALSTRHHSAGDWVDFQDNMEQMCQKGLEDWNKFKFCDICYRQLRLGI